MAHKARLHGLDGSCREFVDMYLPALPIVGSPNVNKPPTYLQLPMMLDVDRGCIMYWDCERCVWKPFVQKLSARLEPNGDLIVTQGSGDCAVETNLGNLRGPQGERGLVGPKGDKGDTVVNTVTGPKGEKGDKGDIGPQGVKGDTGPQGERGIGVVGAFVDGSGTVQVALTTGHMVPAGDLPALTQPSDTVVSTPAVA